jgi:hypothetical protein
VEAHGFFGAGPFGRSFEYELFAFIQHSELESGWANVYSFADAFGRGGYLGVALMYVIIAAYGAFFGTFGRYLSVPYMRYLWILFSIYVFMQGVFSLGLVVSFVLGPMLCSLLMSSVGTGVKRERDGVGVVSAAAK